MPGGVGCGGLKFIRQKLLCDRTSPLSVCPRANRVFRIGWRLSLEVIEFTTNFPSIPGTGGNRMWTKSNRRRYDRSGLRYKSDLTDDEWSEIAPLLPPAKPGGNKRSVNLREVVNGLMYILSTGCQWRA
jgi:hypothetical protein